jgi:hypothetical protein
MVFEFLFVIQSCPAHSYNALSRPPPLFWLYYMYNWPACLIPINDWYPMFQHDTISTADTLCLFHITVTWARNRIDFFPFFSFIILQILSRIFEFSKIRHIDIKQKSFCTTSGNLREGSEIWYRLMIEVKVHVLVTTTKSKQKLTISPILFIT